MAELSNGNVVRLNYAEKRLDALEPTVHGLERDVADIKRSNTAIAEDVSEIKQTIKDAAEGKVKAKASDRAAIILASGAIFAALVAAASQLAGG